MAQWRMALLRGKRGNEVSLDAEATLYHVQELIGGFRVYHNDRRPHSALRYLQPVDYYRGDPEARLAKREARLRQAEATRRPYWRP
jgi:hypothetical protein